MKIKFFLILFLFCFVFSRISFAVDLERERLHIAEKAFSDGFYDASILLFKRFAEEFPQSKDFIKAKLYLAKCYYFKENYLDALKVLNEIVPYSKTDNLTDEIYYWLGEINFKGKNYRDALMYEQKIIDDYPKSKFYWWAYYLVASSYVALTQETTKGEEMFKTMIENVSDEKMLEKSYLQLFNMYLKKRDFSHVVDLGEQYLKKYPKGTLRDKVYFYQGKSYYTQNEWKKAVACYKAGLEVSADPALKDLMLQAMGLAFLADADLEDAKQTIDRINDKELRIFSQGIYFFKTQDYAQALQLFDEFLKQFPQSISLPNVCLNKAETLYAMGRINDSLSIYHYIIDTFKVTNPSEIIDKAHYGLAWCYLKNGEFKKAIEEFKNTLKYTDNPVVKMSSQMQMADAYQEAGDFSKALEIYSDILEKNVSAVYADYIQFQIGMVFLKTKKISEATLAFKNLEHNFPSSKLIPQAKYYLAVGYFSQGSYLEAKNILEDFMNAYPKSDFFPKANYLYAKCFFNENDYQKALEIFKGMIGKFKQNDVEQFIYIDMGNCYLNLTSFDEARKIWEEFLVKFPKSQHVPTVILYLGGLYEKDNRFAEAEGYYKRLVADFKESPLAQEALLSLGHLYLNNNEVDKAQEYLNSLAQMNSSLAVKGKFYLAKVYVRKGEPKQALAIYDELINTASPVAQAAVLDKAFLLREMEDYTGAIELFRKAITGGLDSPRVRYVLGMCLEKIGKNKEAIDEYFNIVYTFSDDNEFKVKAYFRIAKLYETMGDPIAAKEIYQKIVTFNATEEAGIAKERLMELESNIP